MSTLFSKIIAREIPARIAFEDDRCLAFHDIDPQAPVHLLVIPKKEIARVALTELADEPLLGHLIRVAQMVAKQEGLHETGFRLVINNGPDGGESVPHLHVPRPGRPPHGMAPRLIQPCFSAHIVSHNICYMKATIRNRLVAPSSG